MRGASREKMRIYNRAGEQRNAVVEKTLYRERLAGERRASRNVESGQSAGESRRADSMAKVASDGQGLVGCQDVLSSDNAAGFRSERICHNQGLEMHGGKSAQAS